MMSVEEFYDTIKEPKISDNTIHEIFLEIEVGSKGDIEKLVSFLKEYRPNIFKSLEERT